MRKIKAILYKVKSFLKKIIPKSVVRLYQRLKKTIQGKWAALKKRIAAFRNTSTYLSARAKKQIEPNVILYESHSGIGLTCNPYAIFRAFMGNDDFGQYTHVWSIDSGAEIKKLYQMYGEHKNVRFVLHNKDDYQRTLATAKLLINNSTFPYYFSKREGQCFINTWHSITVKTLGFDIPNGAVLSANILRNLLMSDHILSANPFMTDIFAKAYKLRGLYPHPLLETGSPRNDMILSTERGFILEKLAYYGVKIDPRKKIILYAPTWKGKNHLNPTIDLEEYKKLQNALVSRIDMEQYQVLIKPHHVVFKKSNPEQRKGIKVIPPSIDTNELLSIVDVLISDYSSIYFDFLITGRPVLFYIPDLEEYTEYRGTYFSIDELPGPAADTYDGLIDNLLDLENVTKQYRQRYDATREWACVYDDGRVADHVVDAIVKEDFTAFKQVSMEAKCKKKLLLSMSRLNMNGVTITGMKLLDTLDYDRYDVSMVVHPNKDPMSKEFLAQINPNVRLFYRVGAFYRTPREKFDYWAILEDRFRRFARFPAAAFQRETKRLFGDSLFDVAIDFSGYVYFDASLISQTASRKKLIWQHSDVQKDMENKRKKSAHGKNLRAIANHIYTRMDAIVSSSFYIMGENMENLATPETIEKFTYASNLINDQRISEGIGPEQYIEMDDTLYYKVPETNREVRHLRRLPDHDEHSFVMVGRLSSEKNQANLIRAFARVEKEYPNVKLYLIGDGILKNSLTKQINKLNLKGKISMLGNLANPFAIMNKCNCFIFPSLYESQGLGIMEARVLGMPIIVSNYEAVDSVTMPGGQILIGHSEEDIFLGMRAFIRGEARVEYTFDLEEYNRNALAEFDRLLRVE